MSVTHLQLANLFGKISMLCIIMQMSRIYGTKVNYLNLCGTELTIQQRFAQGLREVDGFTFEPSMY